MRAEGLVRPRLTRRYPLLEFAWSLIGQLWPAYVLASILILYGFGWGLPNTPYQDKSFHADENALVWGVSQISYPLFNPRWLPWGTGLFYQVYAVKTLITAGGLVHLDDYWVYVIGRVVVYGSAIGAITALYLLGRRLFDAQTGRMAAVILAVLPGFVINSHYLKADVPATFWLLITLLAAHRVVTSGRASDVYVLGLLIGYTISVKYSTAALVPAGLVAIAAGMRTPSRRLYWLQYPVCVLVGFGLGTPYAFLNIPGFIDALRLNAAINTAGSPYYPVRPPGWVDYVVNVLPLALGTPMLAVTVVAVAWSAFRGGKRLRPLWMFLLLYYFALGMDRLRLIRYTVPLVPFAALFGAYLIRDLSKTRAVRWFAFLGASTVLAYTFVFSLAYIQAMAMTDPRVQASRWIEQHLNRYLPIAVSTTHYLDVPQVHLMGFQRVEVGFSIPKLQAVPGPYLVLSEFGTRLYEEAIDRYPMQRGFFDYVKTHYVEIAYFENSQRLLGIDAKNTSRMAHDWLHPNPRISVLMRRIDLTPSPKSEPHR